MLTNPSSASLDQSASPLSLLGIFFFLVGAPHIYGALKRREQRRQPLTSNRYVMAAALVSAIAGAVELSLL
jgi:hypothetical protein